MMDKTPTDIGPETSILFFILNAVLVKQKSRKKIGCRFLYGFSKKQTLYINNHKSITGIKGKVYPT